MFSTTTTTKKQSIKNVHLKEYSTGSEKITKKKFTQNKFNVQIKSEHAFVFTSMKEGETFSFVILMVLIVRKKNNILTTCWCVANSYNNYVNNSFNCFVTKNKTKLRKLLSYGNVVLTKYLAMNMVFLKDFTTKLKGYFNVSFFTFLFLWGAMECLKKKLLTLLMKGHRPLAGLNRVRWTLDEMARLVKDIILLLF